MPTLGEFGGSFKDGACLHFGDLGIGDAETAAAMTEHRVEFMEGLNASFDFFFGDVELGCEFFNLLGRQVHELVEGWVEQADGDRQAAHGFEYSHKILFLEGEKFHNGCAALGFVLGDDHFAHGENALGIKEHVFGAGEADALGAEGARL
jgi:hypothetical protein